jgi:hypothetical protein
MGVGSQKWHRNGPVPENNRNGLEKRSCKPVEQEENHEKGHAGRGLETIWEMSVELLREGSSIKETASSLGYKHSTNFTREYKHYWGNIPSQHHLSTASK